MIKKLVVAVSVLGLIFIAGSSIAGGQIQQEQLYGTWEGYRTFKNGLAVPVVITLEHDGDMVVHIWNETVTEKWFVADLAGAQTITKKIGYNDHTGILTMRGDGVVDTLTRVEE